MGLERPKLVLVWEKKGTPEKFTGLERFGWEVEPIENKLGISHQIKDAGASVIILWLGENRLTATRLLKALKGHGPFPIPILFHSDVPLGQLMKVSKEAGADGIVSQTGHLLNLNFELRQHIK